MRFNTIVAFAGGDKAADPAVERARLLAKDSRARVRIIDVVPDMPQYFVTLAPPTWKILRLMGRKREKRIGDLRNRLVEDGVQATRNLLTGKPSVEIVRYVLAHQVDLLVLGLDPGPAPSAGAVVRRVLRVCPGPVWVAKGQADRPIRRVLAAVAPEPAEPNALDRRIVETASYVAGLSGARLDVVHAWSPIGRAILEAGLGNARYSRFEETIRKAAGEALDALLDDMEDPPPASCRHLLKDDPVRAIGRLSTRHEVDVVVMGTVGRKGVAGFMLGNTAETVVRKSPCSVLAVKGDDFVSPLAESLA